VALGTCGTSVRVRLSACHTCCVAGMQYYVCALSSHGIVTYAPIVLNPGNLFVLYCTSIVGACIVLYT